MTLAVGITHAPFIPQRRAWVSQLVRTLRPWAVHVQPDPGRSGSWGNTSRTMRWLSTQPVDHVLHLDDDVQPVPGFVPAVEAICGLRPAHAVCLYVPVPPAREARWAISDGNMYGCGMLLPRTWVADWLAWSDLHVRPDFWSCDIRLKFWLRTQGHTVWTPLPGLLTHLGSDQSLVGTHMPGGAVVQDAATIDWSTGLDRPLHMRSRVSWLFWWRKARRDANAPPPWLDQPRKSARHVS